MNLDWTNEYYAEHEDGWVWSQEDYKRYGLNDSEVFVADWLTACVSCRDAVAAVLALVVEAEGGIEGEWKSNDYAYFRGERVVIQHAYHPFEQHEYPSNQISQIVERWGAAMKKYEWFSGQ